MAQDIDVEFGAELAKLRTSSGISQEALAQQLGHDQSFVSRAESGQRVLSLFELFQWIEALGSEFEGVLIRAVRIWELHSPNSSSLWKEKQ